jgi:membrane protein
MSADQQNGKDPPGKGPPGKGPPGKGLGDKAKGLAHSVDRAQQNRPWLAVAVATWKKFDDDQSGNLAALIAYYAFASLFPLLLVTYSILDIISRNNAQLGHRLTTALHQYPVIGTHLGPTASQGLNKTGLALIIGILLTLYGARGIANAIQNAMNNVWGVPRYERPSFPWSILRSFGLMAVLGPGVIITIALSSLAGGTGHLPGALARIAAVAVSLVLNVGLFWLGFRIATSKQIATRDLRLSAILAAIVWQLLQLLGGYFVGHQLKTNSAYGTFAVVLGLLAWFYLQAQITLYVAELNVVRVRRLWPRSLAPPPLTEADLQAYTLNAQTGRQREDLHIDVRQRAGAADSTGGAARPQ